MGPSLAALATSTAYLDGQPPVSCPCGVVCDGGAVRVVSFNVHHGTVGRAGPVDPERLGAVCAAFDADVLALQEVDVGTLRTGGADLPTVVGRACAMASVFGPSRRYPGGWYGNALLVRGEIESWSVAQLPRVPWWRWWQEPRTLLQAAVRVDGRALSLAVTHLAVAPAVNGPQLDRLLDLAARRPDPLVVLGDLNRSPSMVEPTVTAAGLTYVPHGPTIPVRTPRRTIDHCLVSSDIAVARVEVRPTEMSDHAALVVDLAIAPAAVSPRRSPRTNDRPEG